MTVISLEVRDMPKMDLFGWCDPYVKVFTYHKKRPTARTLIHETPIEHNTPEAVYPHFSLEEATSGFLQKLAVNTSMFCFEIWDDDTNSSDDFIGKIDISYEKLSAKKDLNEFVFDIEAGGQLLVTCGQIDLVVRIMLSDLMKMDTVGENDVFFKVVINKEEVYKSEVISGSVTAFKPFDLSLANANTSCNIRVYDEDAITNELIGEITLNLQELVDKSVFRGVLERKLKRDLIIKCCRPKSKKNRGNILIKLLDNKEDYLNPTYIKPEAKAVQNADQNGYFDEKDVLFTGTASVTRGGYFGKVYKAGGVKNLLIPGGKVRRVFVTDRCIFCKDEIETTESEANIESIKDVFLIDSSFEFKRHKTSTRHFTIINTDRKCEIKLEERSHVQKFLDVLKKLYAEKPKEDYSFQSYAEPVPRSKCRWFVQGRDYFWYLSHILEKAKSEIYITDWWFSPEIVLRRPLSKFESDGFTWILEDLLFKKAKQGVQIYVMLFGGLGAKMLGLGAERVFQRFDQVDNIQVITHGSRAVDMFLWSHHEKLVIIDQVVAFVGGADLCAGRWDDDNYRLFDINKAEFDPSLFLEVGDKDGDGDVDIDDVAIYYGESWTNDMDGKLWIGRDYNNTFLKEFSNPEKFGVDGLNRTKQPRMPWQDITSVVYGKAALEVARHFIQRWNFCKKQSQHEDANDEIAHLTYLVPMANRAFGDKMKRIDRDGWYKIPKQIGRENGSPEFTGTVQPLRSLGNWSGGLKSVECSITNAYCSLIKNSKSYVYIENQFFSTTIKIDGDVKRPGNPEVKNDIGQAICERIIRAHENKDSFKIYMVIPLMPEGEGSIFDIEKGNGTARTVMHYQFAGIRSDPPKDNAKRFRDVKDYFKKENRILNMTIFTYLESKGINPADYIYFSALRKHEFINNNTAVTEVIYVHSKLLIVDDQYTIIGSANCNDRSQLGDRDSEFCLLFNSTDYAKSLRNQLWSTFTGTNQSKTRKMNPNSEECWKFWKSVSEQNADSFEKVFCLPPANHIRSFKDLDQYKIDRKPLMEHNKMEARVELAKIKGVLVSYPVRFLEDEWIHPLTLPALAKEKMAPAKAFT